MTDSALDLWNRLYKDQTKEAPAPAFPGNTPPPSFATVDKPEVDWLTSLPSHEFLVAGEPRKFYTIGTLASVLQRSAVTIRSWESKGWLPRAAFRTPAPRKEQIPGKKSLGRRLYSEQQLRFLVEAYGRYNLADPKRADWSSFRRHIKLNYPAN